MASFFPNSGYGEPTVPTRLAGVADTGPVITPIGRAGQSEALGMRGH